MRTLSKVQKNRVADLAAELGLQLADFRWDEVSSVNHGKERVSKLTHVPTGAWFAFDVGGAGLWCRWWPEHERAAPYSSAVNFDQQLDYAHRWLRFVADEHTAVDVWDLAQRERGLLTPPDLDRDTAAFTASERHEIKARLAEIGQYLIETNRLDAEHSQRVEAKIEYLQGAVDRLDRFDFRGVLGSTLLGLAIEAGLHSGAAQAFLAFAQSQLGLFFQRLLTG